MNEVSPLLNCRLNNSFFPFETTLNTNISGLFHLYQTIRSHFYNSFYHINDVVLFWNSFNIWWKSNRCRVIDCSLKIFFEKLGFRSVVVGKERGLEMICLLKCKLFLILRNFSFYSLDVFEIYLLKLWRSHWKFIILCNIESN